MLKVRASFESKCTMFVGAFEKVVSRREKGHTMIGLIGVFCSDESESRSNIRGEFVYIFSRLCDYLFMQNE